MARIFETTPNKAPGKIPMTPVGDNTKLKGPLSVLSSTDKGYLDLRYPRDLSGTNQRQHTVEFFINQPENSTYLQVGTDQSGPAIVDQSYLFGQSSGTWKDILSGAVTGGTAAAILLAKSALGNTKETISLGKGALAIGAAAIGGAALMAANPVISPKQYRLAGSIKMFMPDTVNITNQQSYQEDNMSDYQIPYYGSLGKSVLNTFTAPGESGKPLNPISQTANFLAGIRSSVGKLLPADALLKGQGVAINPQVQLLFKATALRSFQMEFMFSPKSQEESIEVQQIIKTFKFYSAPEIGGNSATTGVGAGLFFVVPATFQVVYKFQGQENLFVNKITECVLESVNVDYAPNGWSTFSDGSPTQIRMTLQFKETQIIDKNKVMQGY